MSASPRFPHLPAESWDLFLEGSLPEAAEARIEQHLAGCDECRAALVEADPSRIFRSLREAPSPEVSWDGFWEGLEAEIASDVPAQRGATRGSWLALLGGVAASVGLAVILLMHAHRTPPVIVATADDHHCPAEADKLHLTREECAALFGQPIASQAKPEVIVDAALDLRGL